MDPQALDVLQQRLTKMERRLTQVLVLMLVGLFVMTTALAVNFVARKVSAQGNFAQGGQPISYSRDSSSGVTCFWFRGGVTALSCVK